MATGNAVAIGTLCAIPALLVTVPPVGWAVCLILAAVVGLSGSSTRG